MDWQCYLTSLNVSTHKCEQSKTLTGFLVQILKILFNSEINPANWEKKVKIWLCRGDFNGRNLILLPTQNFWEKSVTEKC